MSTQIVSVNFSLSIFTLFIGAITVSNLLSKEDGKNTWNSQGFWDWQPGVSPLGLGPPIDTYWHERRSGGWNWQFDRNTTHLLLAEKAFFFKKTAIGIADINREKLLNKDSQNGYWVMTKEFGDHAGTWQMAGYRYEYPSKDKSIWEMVKGKLEISK